MYVLVLGKATAFIALKIANRLTIKTEILGNISRIGEVLKFSMGR
jgi:hypothetical protein